MTDEGDAALAGLSDDEFRRHLASLSTAELRVLIDGWFDGDTSPFVHFIPLLDQALEGREHDPAWADCWFRIAAWLVSLSRYHESIDAFDQAAQVFAACEQPLDAARCLMGGANAMLDQECYSEAIIAYDQAEPVFIAYEQFAVAARCQMNRAIALQELGYWTEAIAAYGAAEPVLVAHEQFIYAARCRANRAGALGKLRRFAEAVAAFDAAEHVFAAHEEFISAAACQTERASALQELGRFAEAIEAYDQAEPVLTAHKQTIFAARCQMGRATAMLEMDRYAEAIAGYDKTEPLFIALEQGLPAASCQLNRATALQKLGRFAEAIAGYDQAEPVFAAYEQFIDAAGCQMNRAAALSELGRCAEAIAAYDTAEQVFFAHDQFASAALCQMNRASVMLQLGHFEEAIASYSTAAEAFTVDEHPINAAIYQANRAICQLFLGHRAEAIAGFTTAETVFIDHEHLNDAARCQVNRANALMELGRFAEAIEAYDQADPVLVAHEQLIDAARCQVSRGYALCAADRPTEVLPSFLAACTTLEQALTRVGGDAEMSSGLRSRLPDPYLPAIELLLADAIEADHDDRIDEAAELREQAFILGERGRSARLREELSRRLVEIDLDLEGEDSTLVAKWKTLQSELAELDARLRKQGEAGTRSLTAERELQDPKRTSILRALDALERELFVVSPELADLVSPQLPSLAELQADLAPDEGVIAFLLAPKGSTLVRFCIDADGLASASLSDEGEAVRDELAKLAACVASCEKQDGRPEAGSAGDARFWQESLQELSQLLLGGLEEDPRTSGWLTGGKKRLTFVPSGALFDLPFAALSVPGGDGYEALISRKELAVAVSPQSFTRLYQKGKGEKSAGAVAVVSPNGDLGSTGAEIAALRAAMPQIAAHHGDTNTAGGHPITAEDFPGLITGHSLVHLTCHGEAEPSSPMQSKLLFAGDSEGNPTALTALQVYGRLRGQHELFFAAACESGEAQVLSGDEALGMHRALLYRSRQVVTTLYQVSHQATLILEQLFYEHYAQSGDAASALAAAQRAFLEAAERHADGAPAHEHDELFGKLSSPENPYFWAGLQVMG